MAEARRFGPLGFPCKRLAVPRFSVFRKLHGCQVRSSVVMVGCRQPFLLSGFLPQTYIKGKDRPVPLTARRLVAERVGADFSELDVF